MRTSALNIFNSLTLGVIRATRPMVVYHSRNVILAYVMLETGISIQRLQNVNELNEEEQAKFVEVTSDLNGEFLEQWWKNGGQEKFEIARMEQIRDENASRVWQVIRMESAGPKGFYGVNEEGKAEFYQRMDHPNVVQYALDPRAEKDEIQAAAYELEHRYADVGGKTKIIIAKKEKLYAV